MPKNAVQRLQKIENDLKTVISIYDVSTKCEDIRFKPKNVENQASPCFPKITAQEVLKSTIVTERVREPRTSQFDFLKNSESGPSPKKWKLKKQMSAPLSSTTLSTVCEISCPKTTELEDHKSSEKQDSSSDTDVINSSPLNEDLIYHSKKSKEEIKNLSPSREISNTNEYPDWLIQATSNWFDSIKHSASFNKDGYSSGLSSSPSVISKSMSKPGGQKSEEKIIINMRNIKASQNKINSNKKNDSQINKEKRVRSTSAKPENFITDNINTKNSRNLSEKKEGQFPLATRAFKHQEAQKNVGQEDTGLRPDKVRKIIEKSHEKLEKMKVSKELALDIAKHLKEKYDEIQDSKQQLTEKILKIQKENLRLENELKNAQMKIKELEKSTAEQLERDVNNKKMIEENVGKLKVRIRELEKEHQEKLLENQREIDQIQKERLRDFIEETKNKKNQARDVQRLTSENCELLARNDELELLLSNRHLEKQFLEQKIRHLQEEVQTQKQKLKKKTKTQEEINKELESTRQNSSDLEDQVKILRKNIENYHETKNNLIKQIEEYELQAKLNQEEIKKLQNENLMLKTDLENEKDALLIKTKIIEDQQETLKQLKEKSEEVKALLKKQESLERILNTERDEKLELKDAVERLKWRKEELKKKIKDLEGSFNLAQPEVVQDLKKTQIVLSELEQQVQNKQKEWELQLHSLIKEKEQACSIAEYATRQLIQTNTEFQKQSEAHKKLRKVLAENLAEKKFWLVKR